MLETEMRKRNVGEASLTLLASVKILEHPSLGLIRTIGFCPLFLFAHFVWFAVGIPFCRGNVLLAPPTGPNGTERHAEGKSFNRKPCEIREILLR
jgi:hypothetical protein